MVKDGQPWLYDPAFPANLEGYWDELWGYVADQGIAPVWVGEWGSMLPVDGTDQLSQREMKWGIAQVWVGEWGSVLPVDGTDQLSQREMKWVAALRNYIRKKQLSWTWFTWGPNSKDTGGVLHDDWDTVEQGKMEVMARVMHPAFGPAIGDRPPVPPRHGLLLVYAPENASGISMPVAGEWAERGVGPPALDISFAFLPESQTGGYPSDRGRQEDQNAGVLTQSQNDEGVKSIIGVLVC
ncbi:unnamed protein product [Closterium sp. NIES-64]|nr:unnamed protein product [Closterium sp. NIES-64]